MKLFKFTLYNVLLLGLVSIVLAFGLVGLVNGQSDTTPITIDYASLGIGLAGGAGIGTLIGFALQKGKKPGRESPTLSHTTIKK